MKANFIQSGICCQLRWALLGDITFNQFLEKYWSEIGCAWNEIQSTPRDIRKLTDQLIRLASCSELRQVA